MNDTPTLSDTEVVSHYVRECNSMLLHLTETYLRLLDYQDPIMARFVATITPSIYEELEHSLRMLDAVTASNTIPVAHGYYQRLLGLCVRASEVEALGAEYKVYQAAAGDVFIAPGGEA